jgi:phage terminase large subunit-like protein
VTATASQRVVYGGLGAQVRRFGEQFIIQTKGRWAGQPLSHEPWEAEVTDELFLTYENGERVYDEALIGIARKNGKSTFGAELALHALVGSREQSPEVYAAAASREQARIVFGQARDFVAASPRLSDWLVVQQNVILCKANNGVFRVLASDAPLQHGLNPSFVVIDELWAHKNPELYFALTTGQLARENPLVVSITTAGWDRASICYALYERGRRLMREGGLNAMRQARFYCKWMEADPLADFRDESVWKEANPSSWVTVDRLRREYKRLPENVFRRLHLNQWTATEEAWIKPHQWDACEGEPWFDADEPAWMAVDVGVRRDSAGIVWVQWHGEELHTGQLILVPAEQSPTFGVADVRGHVAANAGVFHELREVDYDPWSFRESAEILAESGLPMVEFPQSAGRMGPASEQIYELVTEGRLVHDGDPVMRAHVLAGVAAPTDRGGWRISKRKSLERIDGLVALAMAADRAVTMRFEKPRIFSLRDFRIEQL